MEGVVNEGPRKARLHEVVRMVLWAMFGIRKREEHEKLAVTPGQVITIALIAGAVFVGTLVSVVRFITS